MGMMIKKLDPNDPKVKRNRILFQAGIPSQSTDQEIGECLTERLKEIITVATICNINIERNVVYYDENTNTIYFE